MPDGVALDEFLQLVAEHAVSCGADPEAECRKRCDYLKHAFLATWKETVDVFDFHFSLRAATFNHRSRQAVRWLNRVQAEDDRDHDDRRTAITR